jgi:hypothetical protein
VLRNIGAPRRHVRIERLNPYFGWIPCGTPVSAPIRTRSLHSPRCPMRNTFPASLERPAPSDSSGSGL